MVQYYDYVLGLIPLVLVGVTAALWLAGLSVTMALPTGAGISALVIGHALFVNMPTQPTAEAADTSQRANME